MRSVLVTGGAGYIGSHTAKALAKAGYSPVVLDNLRTGHRWAVQWGPMVEGDIEDRDLVRQVLRDYRIGAVIHFAASAEVGESMQDPYKYLHGNVAGSLALLEAMREEKVRNIVFSSTCATYGIPTQIPISEKTVQSPVNPYGESKLFIERAMKWYGRVHGTRWAAMRYFNAAGADPDGEIGEVHEPESHLIPLVVQAAMGQGPAIQVMGTDYPTPDGTAIRDYIHVADLADAHIRALDYLTHGGESSAFNLGTACGHSVREVISAVERVSGSNVPMRECPRRAGDPPVLVAETAHAESVLGWKPRYRNLDATVRTAWKWHAAQTPYMAAAAG